MKRMYAAAAAAILTGLVFAPVAAAQTPAASPTAAQTAKSDYSKKKQNRFWRVVRSYDPMVEYAGKRSTVDLGISTCDLLRAGGDMYDLALLVYQADAGIAEDSIIAVIAAAPVVLCPDQAYKFE